MEKYNALLPKVEKEKKKIDRITQATKRSRYETFEEAALIKLDI